MAGSDTGPRAPLSIRSRLLIALAIALAPVLMLGVAQTATVRARDVEKQHIILVDAARRSAATVEARAQAGAVLLQTLAPQTTGLQCGQILRGLVDHLSGYENLIRFDKFGGVSCASNSIAAASDQRSADWFTGLQSGDPLTVVRAPAEMASTPSVLAAVRADKDGAFDGAMAAVISLASLRPDARYTALPTDSQVALVDTRGEYLSATDPKAFPAAPTRLAGRAGPAGLVFDGRDAAGRRRIFAAAPLIEDDLYVVMSAPTESLAAWSQANLFTTVAPPLLAFLLAVFAVWVVADRVVVRWLHYIQRIAAIYAKGRFTVRAVRAEMAPPEIAELAATLDSMADAIVERDASLQESLAEKDRLMREIHHRVKNNLQVISSLVSMQQRSLTDPKMRESLDDIRQRIAALALIYRTLYQGPNLTEVDLKSFLEDLTAQLVMSESMHGHAVNTRLTAEHLSVDPDRLAPLSLFAVEAITNAQKHAFRGRGGSLDIHFFIDGEIARFEIADSGGGDPEGALERLPKGVGGILMNAFARQLGGKVVFVINDAGGITALLSFPVADPVHVANIAAAAAR